MDYDKHLHDPHAAALWHAIALRRLSNYRAARENAKQHGDDVAGLMEPPTYEETQADYTRLVEENIDQGVTNTNGARCVVDLMAAIAQDQEFTFVFESGSVVSMAKDRADMVRLIDGLGGWINKREIDEAIVVEREREGRR